MDTNGHQLEKEQTTTDYTDSTDYARSALECGDLAPLLGRANHELTRMDTN